MKAPAAVIRRSADIMQHSVLEGIVILTHTPHPQKL